MRAHRDHELIGRKASVAAVSTPALVIDLAALRANIAAMAQFCAQHGVALRPHAKTHKSARLAALQIEAGAVGVCCAKLAEAEALFADGFGGEILITSPIVAPRAFTRLGQLLAQRRAVSVVVDHPETVAQLAQACPSDASLTVLVDIDPGIHRTGVADAAHAVALARAIVAQPPLRFGGVQFYCGLHQHIAGFEDRRDAIAERTAYLRSILAALQAAGLPAAIVTGSGTGTCAFDAASGVFSEVQAGSYVFLDRQYTDCELDHASAPQLSPALFVAARVISCNTPGLATLDAGYKAFAADAGAPVILQGPHAGARVIFMGDEHCAVVSSAAPFTLGEVLLLQPPHCDPTVNLYDAYHVMDGGALVDLWPISARGASQ
jgi:D-serine deaminase-like pyridoxal phosphate-dependent protein